ncbi:MAG: ABC transporter substrate-binding protein [Pseudomonadota bacterium]
MNSFAWIRLSCLLVLWLSPGLVLAEPSPDQRGPQHSAEANSAEHRPQPGDGELQTLRFQPDWFPNAQFSGFFWAQVDGLYAAQGLDIDFAPFSFGNDFLGAVASGEAAFGTTEAYIFLNAIAKGAPLVAIGVVLRESPAGYIYLADGTIQGPSDLANKRVGVHNYAERLLPFFTEQAGLGPDAAQAKAVQHDMAVLLDGDVDLHQGYATDELLRLAAMTDRPVDILLFERLGLPMYSMVIYTSRATLDQHPEWVDAFLTASAEGWQRAMRSPNIAASVVNQEYPSDAVEDAMVAAQATALKRFVLPDNEPVLSMSRSKWAAMQSAFLASGLIEESLDLDHMLYGARP